MVNCFIGLGSNLGNPLAQVLSALEELDQLPKTRLIKVSRFYESSAIGPGDQPAYINAVALINTNLAPEKLLEYTQQIEDAHGRMRSSERWTARTLDLDILLYGDQEIDKPKLQIPHPEIKNRNFVLYPLSDLRAHLIFPNGVYLRDLLKKVSDNGIWPLMGKSEHVNYS